MSVEFFDDQRREMVAAIRAITADVSGEIGKPALDERVLRAMVKVPRHEFVPIEVQPYALRQDDLAAVDRRGDDGPA